MSNMTRHQVLYPVPSNIDVSLLTLFNCANALTGFIGNTVVCVLVFRYHFLRLRAEILLGSLAVADMVVCVLAQPMYVAHIHNLMKYSYYLQICRKAITWCATLASVNNIFLISIDRFLAVTFLQRYRTVMTLQSLRTAVGATWSLSLIMGISAVFSRKAKIISQYFVIIVLTAVFCLCTRTLMVVHVKARSIMRHLREADLRSSYHLSPILNRERTLAKTVGIIIAAFYISFLPLVVLPFFTAILRKNSAAWNAAWQAFPWVNTLALCGSSINPYIYYWRSARFRMALKTIRLAYLKSVTI